MAAAQLAVALVCAVVYYDSAVPLSPYLQDVEEVAATLLITFVTPTLTFWVLRWIMPSARTLAWTVVGLVVAVNLPILTMLANTPPYNERAGTILTLTFIVAPFLAALAGTFVPPGRITFGSQDEDPGIGRLHSTRPQYSPERQVGGEPPNKGMNQTRR